MGHSGDKLRKLATKKHSRAIRGRSRLKLPKYATRGCYGGKVALIGHQGPLLVKSAKIDHQGVLWGQVV